MAYLAKCLERTLATASSAAITRDIPGRSCICQSHKEDVGGADYQAPTVFARTWRVAVFRVNRKRSGRIRGGLEVGSFRLLEARPNIYSVVEGVLVNYLYRIRKN
jgi:hypothetical protein